MVSEQEIQGQPANVADLVAKIDKLVVALTIKSAPALWDDEQLAEWFGVTAKVAKYTIAARPSFPAPVVPTNASSGRKVWFADEVIEWARKNRGVIPIGRKSGRPRHAT